ncbi:MAG: hypothetical protein FH749_12860 [Firmicutes bacterium]|nr:hypothetical protein [Bacillota bacterium]
MGFITIIDERLFMYLFDVASTSPTLGNLMINISDLSSTIFACIYLFGIAYLIWRKDKKLIPFLMGPAAVAITVQALRILDPAATPVCSAGN